MSRILSLSCVAWLSLSTATAHAQIWTRDPNFAPALRNDVPALLYTSFIPAADGRLLLSGRFTHLANGSVTAPGVAFLRADGSVDSTFNAALSAIFAAPLADGRVLIVHTNPSGDSTIVRLLADGSVDGAYTPITVPYSFSFANLMDGHLVAWSYSLTLNGVDRHRIARFNPDGTLDTSFSAALPSDSGDFGVIVGQSDGKLVVSTYVPAAQYTPRSRVLRLNSDGTVDPTFTAYATTAAPFTSMAVQPNGKVLAGIGSTLVRLNSNGSIDPTFTVQIPALQQVERILVRSDGQIIVQAQQSGVGGGPWASTVFFLSDSGAIQRDLRSVLGDDQTLRLAAIGSDGSVLVVNGRATGPTITPTPQYPVPPIIPIPPVLIPGTSPEAASSTSGAAPITATQTVGTAAALSTATGSIMPNPSSNVAVPWRPALTRIAADGSASTTVNLGVIGEYPGYVDSMSSDAASRLLIVGHFTQLNGQPRPGLARLLPTGALDPTFAPDLDGLTIQRVLLAAPDGGVMVDVQDLGDRGADGLYRVVDKVLRVRPDGFIDPAFASPAGYGGSSDGWHAVASDGRILVSHFSPDSSAETNLHLVWLAANGQQAAVLPTQFSGLGVIFVTPDLPFPPSPVPDYHLAVIPAVFADPFQIVQPLDDGQILVGGSFDHVNGTFVGVGGGTGLARLNSDGSLDASYHPDLTALTGFVYLVSADASGRVVAAGQTWADGQQRSARIRLLPNGNVDRSYRYYSGPPPPYTSPLWNDNGLPDVNFPSSITQSDGTKAALNSVIKAPDGTVWSASPLARFTATDVAEITLPPADQTVSAGHDAVFVVGIGTRQPATYQWFLEGQPITGATLPFLVVSRARPNQAGHYHVQVTIGAQAFISTDAVLNVTGGTARIVNFSALNVVDPGVTPIAGFGISSDGAPRPWLIRGIGPTLMNFGVTKPLTDPGVGLYRASTEIAEDHGSATLAGIAELAHRVGAFPALSAPFYFPGWKSTESALMPTLTTGSYTIHVASSSNQTGTALVEVYDSIPGGASGSLCNLSLRTQIRLTATVATVGFVIAGDSAVNVLVRGSGPALSAFGVAAPLADPKLAVYKQSPGWKSPIASNSGWANNPDVTAAAQKVGAFPLPGGSQDTAILLTLDPGAYTAQVSSVSNATGDALIEVYIVGP